MENKTETISGQRAELFSLGQIVATPGAIEALEQADEDASALIARHVHGDWGEVDKHDWNENNKALRTGERLLSVYTLQNDQRLWISTEADRSVTTLLLPEDY